MKRFLLVVYAAVFSWAVYRSVASAVTVSEAVMYNHYVSTSTLQILTLPYHPANQVLYSLLSRAVLRLFRLTEWSLRIPSLLGLLVYLWCSFRLCRQLCRPGPAFTVAALLFAVNPFTVGWLPESSGIWLAAALFLSASSQLMKYRGAEHELWSASLFFGLAIGSDIYFVFPTVAVLSLFLHFEFWSQRRVSFWTGVNALVLPGVLVVFSLWILPLFARRNAGVQLSEVLRADWVVLLPGLSVLALPFVVEQQRFWKMYASLFIATTAAVAALFLLGNLSVPDRFHAGPEAALPKVARALRDEVRHSPPRMIQVSVSPELIEPFNFYRRRYGLGVVEPVSAKTTPDSADYLFQLDRERRQSQTSSFVEIFYRKPIILYRRAGS